jgi:hypothetical protein
MVQEDISLVPLLCNKISSTNSRHSHTFNPHGQTSRKTTMKADTLLPLTVLLVYLLPAVALHQKQHRFWANIRQGTAHLQHNAAK